MEKLIITACICGAEVTKEHNPAVPYTVEEIAKEAKSAYDAGASIIHLHVREDDGTPTQSKERFEACINAIKEVCPDVSLHPDHPQFLLYWLLIPAVLPPQLLLLPALL